MPIEDKVEQVTDCAENLFERAWEMVLDKPEAQVIAGVACALGVVGVLLIMLFVKCGKRFAARPRVAKVPRRRASTGGNGDCVEIYVGNLSYDMTEEQMRKEFERYGEVKSARIISNRMSNKSKGFGFVEMPNRPEAEAAVKALHDKDVLGRKLRVNEAKNKTRE